MAKVVIDEWGIKRYRDDNGKMHREDGPAIISPCGTRQWYFNNSIIRYISASGINVFYGDAPGPTTSPNGAKEWWSKDTQGWPKLK